MNFMFPSSIYRVSINVHFTSTSNHIYQLLFTSNCLSDSATQRPSESAMLSTVVVQHTALQGVSEDGKMQRKAYGL